MIDEQTKQYRAEWVSKNKDKVHKNHKKWRDEHKNLVHKLNVEYRINNKEKLFKAKSKPENKFKNKARYVSREKISLIDKCCEFCGATEDLHRHHNDYSKPLEITILCRKCHIKWHNENKVANN